MASRKREAQYEAIFGPAGGMAVYHSKNGRDANRKHREKEVAKKLRELRDNVSGFKKRMESLPERPTPLDSNMRAISASPPTDDLDTRSPTDMPSYQQGSLPMGPPKPPNIASPQFGSGEFVDELRGTGDPFEEALGATAEMRRANELQGADASLGGPTYTRDLPMHAGYMRRGAKALAPVLGETLTSGALEGAGFANEVVDFWRKQRDRAMGDAPGGQTGFEPTDLTANRLGIMKGLEEADPHYLKQLYDWFVEKRPDTGTGERSRPPAATSIRG